MMLSPGPLFFKSLLTAFVIHYLATHRCIARLMEHIRHYATSQREIYYEQWLGNLWQRLVLATTAQEYIAYGWDECIAVIARLEEALHNNVQAIDPCLLTGTGWIAEEAFATALLCFMLFPDDPVAVIRRAVFSSGDSDSIGCIAGAFAGAYNGLIAWPIEWIERIEYRARIFTRISDLFTPNAQSIVIKTETARYQLPLLIKTSTKSARGKNPFCDSCTKVGMAPLQLHMAS